MFAFVPNDINAMGVRGIQFEDSRVLVFIAAKLAGEGEGVD